VAFKISVSVTEEEKNEIVSRIVEWCEKYHIWSGECLCQSDNGNIYAPALVADIIDDILQPEVVEFD